MIKEKHSEQNPLKERKEKHSEQNLLKENKILSNQHLISTFCLLGFNTGSEQCGAFLSLTKTFHLSR